MQKKTGAKVKKVGKKESILQMIEAYPELISDGMTDAQIAERFGLSIATVNRHKDDIYKYHNLTREDLAEMRKNARTEGKRSKLGKAMSEKAQKMIEAYPELISDGMTDAQIAERFGLSIATVNRHKDDIYKYHNLTREDLAEMRKNARALGNGPKRGREKSEETQLMIESYPRFLSMGFSDKKIAKACGISSTKTIREHLLDICNFHNMTMDELQEKRNMRPGRCKDERSLKFIHEFLSLREKGLNVPQAAKECKLAEGSGYSLLDKVSERTGLPREDLLDYPEKGNRSNRSGLFEAYDVDIDSLLAKSREMPNPKLMEKAFKEWQTKYSKSIDSNWYEMLEEEF